MSESPSPPPPRSPIKGYLLGASKWSVEGLLVELSRLYPSQCPALKDTDREVWFHAGQRSVIEYLLRTYESVGGNTDNVHLQSTKASAPSQDPSSPSPGRDQPTVGPKSKLRDFFTRFLPKPTE